MKYLSKRSVSELQVIWSDGFFFWTEEVNAQMICVVSWPYEYFEQSILYVCFKFVRQQAVRIYYIPWPTKKLLPKIRTQTCLPKTAKICAAHTANWPMLPKNELQKNICTFFWSTDFQSPFTPPSLSWQQSRNVEGFRYFN